LRLLLDTHVLLWAFMEPQRIPQKAARQMIAPENEVLASAVSAWEIAIKQSVGMLELPGPAHEWLPMACEAAQIDWIDITPMDALRVSQLPWHHRDPFDRLLVAQTQRGLTLVTHDKTLRRYEIPILLV